MKMEKLKLSKLTIYSVQQVELALLNTLNLSNINARFEDLKNSHQPIHKTISEISNFYY